MATYLDLDDAAANVVGDVAQRELDELRRQRDELEKALRWVDWALNKNKSIYTAGNLVTKALANLNTCSSQNTEFDTQHELRCMSERQEQPAVLQTEIKETETMNDFKKYRRSGLAEMRPYIPGEDLSSVSVSQRDDPDTDLGMIARKPENHANQWYVARDHFERNFTEELTEQPAVSINNYWSIEPHGEGWAIYRGRDNQSHGFNLGQLTETTYATVMKIEEALNSNEPAVPKGWKVVPVTSTLKMDHAAAQSGFNLTPTEAYAVWDVMVEAAPQPLAEQPAVTYTEDNLCSRFDSVVVDSDERFKVPAYQEFGETTPQPPVEKAAVPKGWSIEKQGNMFLIQKHDANGKFVKGQWIAEQHGHVICEMLSEMHHGGRE